MPASKPNEVRFEQKTERIPFSSCWFWTGASVRGYGTFWDNQRGKTVRAHRFAYEMENGAIDDDCVILHKCDNPSCVNPVHLVQGTQADNIQDMVAKRRNRFGESVPWSKLTESDVIEIRRTKGENTNQECAEKFGVSVGSVCRIRARHDWKHL